MGHLLKYGKRHPLAAMIIIAVVIRLIYILLYSDHWQLYDTIHYVTAARHIIEGNGFGPSMHFGYKYGHYCLEPIYPIFIAVIYFLFGFKSTMIKIFQIGLAIGQILLLYDLAKSFRSRAIMLLTGAFSAVYPFYVVIVGLVYPTQLFITLLLGLVWFLLRFYRTGQWGYLVGAGVAYGLAIQTGPVLVPSVPLVLIWLWRFAAIRANDLVVFTGCLLLTLTPWTIRNYSLFHKIAPGRGCLEEQRFINHFYYQLLAQRALQDSLFNGRKIDVCFCERGGFTWLDGYLDGRQIVSLRVLNDRLPIDENRYFGVIFEGQRRIRMQRLLAYENDIILDEQNGGLLFDSADTVRCVATEGMICQKPVIELTDALQNKWNNKLIFDRPLKARRFTYFLPDSIQPESVRRMALLVFLDKPALDANGYMLWLQNIYEFDLWKVKEGKPQESLAVEKHLFHLPRVDVWTVLIREPKAFILDHFLPEFLNFWSPVVRKIDTPPAVPSILLQFVSVLFFLPLLVLTPIGMIRYRKEKALLWLSVIFIATIALGYSLFSTEIRYRLPVDGFLILWAAAGAVALWQRFWTPAPIQPD